MGTKLQRNKPRNLLLTLIYRIQKILPLRTESKFKLFLDLEWIFDRLAHEASFKFYNRLNHPVRVFSSQFLLANIRSTDTVLDLGCHTGDLSLLVAEKAKEVVGVDYNKEYIQLAEERNTRNNLSFIHGEAIEYLAAQKNKYSVLILSHLLEHIDEPEVLLMKFKVFFEYIYIEVPDYDKTYLNHYRKDLKLDLIYTDNDHISEFDRDEISQLLYKCGIAIERSEFRYGVQKLWCKVKH